MTFLRSIFAFGLVGVLSVLPCRSILAEENGDDATVESLSPTATTGRVGFFGISGGLGYHTYGVNNVNNSFLDQRNGSFNGGVGYGAALKYGVSERFTAKLGVDFLEATADSTHVINGVQHNSRVELPATMVFVGGDFALAQMPTLDLKLSAGYLLVSIYNGQERGADGSRQDMGAISGSTSGFQIGTGLELFLTRGFSLETSLAYNFAKIERATFAAAPADINSGSTNGIVDYSGLVGKVAFTFYLFP